MSALRTGIDLVVVDDVRDALRVHGDRYLNRLFTPGEQADCRDRDGAPDPQRLAARFAAKEAAIKVLRPRDVAVPWRAIEVVRDPGGWVDLRWHEPAADLAAAAGLGVPSLSLTHERDTAAAVVVATVMDHHKPSPDAAPSRTPRSPQRK